jgi:hypothetical protein
LSSSFPEPRHGLMADRVAGGPRDTGDGPARRNDSEEHLNTPFFWANLNTPPPPHENSGSGRAPATTRGWKLNRILHALKLTLSRADVALGAKLGTPWYCWHGVRGVMNVGWRAEIVSVARLGVCETVRPDHHTQRHLPTALPSSGAPANTTRSTHRRAMPTPAPVVPPVPTAHCRSFAVRLARENRPRCMLPAPAPPDRCRFCLTAGSGWPYE